MLLAKAKDMLKPFFPQLQTTFMKALNDANRNVRLKAGIALGHLITIHMRPDPLFNEIFNGIKVGVGQILNFDECSKKPDFRFRMLDFPLKTGIYPVFRFHK